MSEAKDSGQAFTDQDAAECLLNRLASELTAHFDADNLHSAEDLMKMPAKRYLERIAARRTPMSDDTPTRDEVERDELYLGDSWAALLIAEKARTAQAERERDEARARNAALVEAAANEWQNVRVEGSHAMAALLACSYRLRALVTTAETDALEKVRREAWVSGMIDAANIIGRMKVEDRKQWAALDAAQDLIRAALRGDDT